MVDTTYILLACYTVNIIALFLLGGFFFREYFTKRLKASASWGFAFILYALVVINLAFLATGEISKSSVMVGVILTSVMMALFYYGASLLFFSEGSFFREKFAVILFFLIFAISSFIVIYFPTEEIVAVMRTVTTLMMATVFFLIGVLFYRVSGRLPRGDPRRRTVTLVAAAWFIVVIWLVYIAFFWGEYAIPEALVFLLGSSGFLLLLYGMTTGRATRA